MGEKRFSSLIPMPDGKLSTGKIPKRTAEAIKTRVEYLVNAQVIKHPIDGDTAKWVASLDDVLAGKLARVGLVQAQAVALLGNFVADYLAKRGGTIKPGTMQIWRLTQRNLAGFFGEDMPLRDFTAGDAEDFRNHLLTGGLAESTTRKRCATASMMFRYAVKHRLIDANPFDDVPKANMATKDHAFIPEADALRVLELLPNTQWRLLFALSRWGGLRVGSEVRRLQWADIDWQRRTDLRSMPPRRNAIKATKAGVVPIFRS